MSDHVAPPRPEGCDVLHDDRHDLVTFCDPDLPAERWIACDPDLPVVARP
jgi:hypothetical protein